MSEIYTKKIMFFFSSHLSLSKAAESVQKYNKKIAQICATCLYTDRK